MSVGIIIMQFVIVYDTFRRGRQRTNDLDIRTTGSEGVTFSTACAYRGEPLAIIACTARRVVCLNT